MMNRTFLNTRVLADPAWWHWAITIPLLAAHVCALPGAIEAALVLCATMALYYLLRLRRVRPFPVQVRLAYLGWLLMGLLPAMHWMHYIALAGTTAMVTVGYCPLGRVLSLLWFNRTEHLSLSLLKRVLSSPPDGGLFYYRPMLETGRPICSCSSVQGSANVAPQRRSCSTSLLEGRVVSEEHPVAPI
jgi:hypothetical protein